MTTQQDAETAPTPSGVNPLTRQRISTQQTLHLMRLEAERALRHHYPITFLAMGLDGLEDDADLTRKLTPLLFQQLKGIAFENDLRGLGIRADSIVLASFPHIDPEKLQVIASELVTRVRVLEHDGLPEDVTLTASVGISHNLHPGESSFESLVEEAEVGMGLARSAGGDRVMLAKEVERELDRLRAEVEQQIEELSEFQNELFGNADDENEVWGKRLVDKVIDLFRREPEQSGGLLRTEKEVIALLRFELAQWRETSSAQGLLEAKATIEKLERRVAKLTQGLDFTETELKRVAKLKNIDLGVASIYRTVQGLSSEDGCFEQKKEMLKDIFEANLAFREEAASK